MKWKYLAIIFFPFLFSSVQAASHSKNIKIADAQSFTITDQGGNLKIQRSSSSASSTSTPPKMQQAPAAGLGQPGAPLQQQPGQPPSLVPDQQAMELLKKAREGGGVPPAPAGQAKQPEQPTAKPMMQPQAQPMMQSLPTQPATTSTTTTPPEQPMSQQPPVVQTPPVGANPQPLTPSTPSAPVAPTAAPAPAASEQTPSEGHELTPWAAPTDTTPTPPAESQPAPAQPTEQGHELTPWAQPQ